jgi:hypothetical protein
MAYSQADKDKVEAISQQLLELNGLIVPIEALPPELQEEVRRRGLV